MTGACTTPRSTRQERLDRLLLILAIAYLLLCGIGLIVLQTGNPGDWSSSTRNECSVFTIGRIMLGRLKITLPASLHAIITATEGGRTKLGMSQGFLSLGQNWGKCPPETVRKTV